jgi:hypothetical protein
MARERFIDTKALLALHAHDSAVRDTLRHLLEWTENGDLYLPPQSSFLETCRLRSRDARSSAASARRPRAPARCS